MGISSVGAGSGVLTQDILDQLRAADEAAKINPISSKISVEENKERELEVLDAQMQNLSDAIGELASASLFDARSTEVTGDSVSITADENSDLQDFSLDVVRLATKQIEESAGFSGEDALVAGGSGEINLNIDGTDYKISYDAATTLKELKNSINQIAGEKVDATLVNMGTDDIRLFISSASTGDDKDISITNFSGTAIDAKITGMSTTQAGVNAQFTFNGGIEVIERTSNSFDDLISGYNITLNEIGSSEISVAQNRDDITDRIDSFIEKYNEAMSGLTSVTKSSVDADARGAFASESVIKSMRSTVEDMIGNAGSGIETLYDFGFDVDKDGVMSIDKDMLNDRLDDGAVNFEAFFSGGTYTKDDNSTVELEGVFNEMFEIIESYTEYNGILDDYQSTLTENISAYEDRKAIEIENLNDKYETMEKRFIAYDLMMSKISSASSMFAQMVNTETDS